MIKKKTRVVVLFGGKSAEHEVSIQSAKNVVASLDNNKYDVVLIKIEKDGKWDFNLQNCDVVFPVLHGPYGEDGSMQGLLTLMGVPFVGAGVLGSAVSMDKDVMKRLLRDAGIPIGRFLTLRKGEKINFEFAKKELGLPLFIKPANLGSSIGISKVNDRKTFEKAINEAFLYDTKILIEEFIKGKEIECAVLGNNSPIVSVAGEISPVHEFYDYDAKYFDENGAILKIPAALSAEKLKELQALAIRTFQVLCLEGMARIDCFYTDKEEFYVNESNTIPGFTDISMYPKLWKASGITNGELVDQLIELAINRHMIRQQLKTSIS